MPISFSVVTLVVELLLPPFIGRCLSMMFPDAHPAGGKVTRPGKALPRFRSCDSNRLRKADLTRKMAHPGMKQPADMR